MNFIKKDQHIFGGHSFTIEEYILNSGREWYIAKIRNSRATFNGYNRAEVSDKVRAHIKRVNHYNQH